jgi:hypothetical protein
MDALSRSWYGSYDLAAVSCKREWNSLRARRQVSPYCCRRQALAETVTIRGRHHCRKTPTMMTIRLPPLAKELMYISGRDE